MAMIFQTQTDLVYRTYCGSSAIFCLFSESRASSLSEAQSSCKEINPKSWPVELIDGQTVDYFIEFIQNYSICNIILNAEKKGDSWFWIKSADGKW